MVDRQHRIMARTGSGPASFEDANIQKKERLKKLALQTIDINKDPYFLKNHLGTYQCRLCLTLHSNQGNPTSSGSYLAHTQGKKHQSNLSRRISRQQKDAIVIPQKKQITKSKTIKSGKPFYRFKKQRDLQTGNKQVQALQKILFQIQYPLIEPNIVPKFRIMSAYEQKIEAPEKNFQYLLFAAQPYTTIGFKIPNLEIDRSEQKFYTSWDKQKRLYLMMITFKQKQ